MSKELRITLKAQNRDGQGPLARGLRATSDQGKNNLQLTECRSVEARPQGLVTYDAITQPIATATLTAESITVAHPFPQLFRLPTATYLLTATKIYSVNESTWAITQITTYDLLTPASTKTISTGGTWQVADFMGTFYFFNGVDMLIKYAQDAKVYVQDTVTTRSGCAHRGRLVLGGFSTSDYWSSTWKTKWLARITQDSPPNSSILQTMTDIGPNWIWWSSIGGGDTKFFYDPTYANTGPYSVGHSSTNPLYVDYVYRNEWGWMPLPFREAILAIHPLGRRIVVFGGDGMAVLQQAGEPTPTYGLLFSEPMGLAQRGAVGGDDRECIFVTEDGCLWHMDQDSAPRRLGYEEFLAPQLSEAFTISLNPFRRDWYIGTETKGFLLTSTGGFTEIPQMLTKGISVGGGFVGIREQHADQGFALTTDTFDMDIAGIKQIQGVSISGSGFSGMNLKVQYRYDQTAAFSETAAIPINPDGFAHVTVSGRDFRISLERTSSANVSISELSIKWTTADRRELVGRP